MKRGATIALGWVLSVASTYPQGHVIIGNYVSPYNQIVWTPCAGGQAITNANFKVQIYYAKGIVWDENALVPGAITAIDPVFTYDPGHGHGGGGFFTPVIQALPNWIAGDTFTFQLRGWLEPGPYTAGRSALWQETSTIRSIASPPEYAAAVPGVMYGPLGWSHPPQVDLPPSDKTAPVGGMAIFSVSAYAYFSLQWFFNDSPIEGAVTEELVLNNVQTNDAGVYSISLFGCGTVTCSANLNVVVPPTLVAGTLPSPDYIQALGFPLKIMVQTPGVYRVQASTNLVHWTSITNLSLEVGETEFLERSAVTHGRRFYRIANQ